MNIISALEVQQLFNEANIWTLNTYWADAIYTPLDETWLMTTFKDAWLTYLFNFGLTKPMPEKGDCDDYAVWLMAFVKILHRRTPGGPMAALAMGLQFYTPDIIAPQRHGINPCIVRAAGVNYLKFLEPQPQAYGLIPLSISESESVDFEYM